MLPLNATLATHHMVSEPRLLIRESMVFEGMSLISMILGEDGDTCYFNPDLPPIFDEIQNNIVNVSVSLYLFDPYSTRLAGSPKILPGSLMGNDDKNATLLVNGGQNDDKMLPGSLIGNRICWCVNCFIVFNKGVHSSTTVWAELLCSIKVVVCAYFDAINKGISTLIWFILTKLVFDPGGFHSSKNRDDSFLRKGV
ncbi:hypothetical protein RND81_14G187900 [Saponaria officinalis]|uniref:Uncharacterized protein n=1 Tax=Saponaria officinalis TaxID=3572 RepID=A0AAW1GTY2_SAPOF